MEFDYSPMKVIFMNTKHTRQVQQLLMLLLLMVTFSTAFAARPSDQWRLHFNGQAKNDGMVKFQISPVGGQPTVIDLPIKDNTKENAASREATDKLEAVLDENYKISHQDGEEVQIKRRSGRADFVLEVLSNTVEGLSVKTDRE